MFTINKAVENEKAVLELEGRLDTVTAPELESAVIEILPAVTDLTLDFKKLDYISSSGLRVLLSSHKAMTGKGKMKIINVNETITEVFDVTGFTDILDIQ